MSRRISQESCFRGEIDYMAAASFGRCESKQMSDALRIEGLTKRFGDNVAVDNVSLTVDTGEVLGFLGPNGAGKSTTMKMIAGFLTPTSGTAVVKNHDVLVDPLSVKRVIGYLPEGAPAYPDMTPLSFLGFIAGTRGYDGAERSDRVDDAIRRTRISSVALQPIETLSKGYKRRVGLAQALLHDPEVLILDEPTTGLHMEDVRFLLELLQRLVDEGNTVVVVEHHIEFIAAADWVIDVGPEGGVAGGQIVACGRPAEIADVAGSYTGAYLQQHFATLG